MQLAENLLPDETFQRFLQREYAGNVELFCSKYAIPVTKVRNVMGGRTIPNMSYRALTQVAEVLQLFPSDTTLERKFTSLDDTPFFQYLQQTLGIQYRKAGNAFETLCHNYRLSDSNIHRLENLLHGNISAEGEMAFCIEMASVFGVPLETMFPPEIYFTGKHFRPRKEAEFIEESPEAQCKLENAHVVPASEYAEFDELLEELPSLMPKDYLSEVLRAYFGIGQPRKNLADLERETGIIKATWSARLHKALELLERSHRAQEIRVQLHKLISRRDGHRVF